MSPWANMEGDSPGRSEADKGSSPGDTARVSSDSSLIQKVRETSGMLIDALFNHFDESTVVRLSCRGISNPMSEPETVIRRCRTPLLRFCYGNSYAILFARRPFFFADGSLEGLQLALERLLALGFDVLGIFPEN